MRAPAIRVFWMRPVRALVLPAVLLAGSLAAGDAAANDGWRALPQVPKLHLRFEDGEAAAPCAALPETPDPSDVACWTTYVDRAAARRSSPLTAETELACVETWQVARPGGACPADAAACVRPELGVFESLAPGLPVDSNVSAVWALSVEMAREYTAFQVLRSGHALNPHRPRIAGLALSQGMLVLYRAHAIHALGESLADAGCADEHVRPYLELAGRVTDEVGRSDVPAILETYPPPGREWARRFHRIQLAVLGRADGVRPGGAWQEDCEKAASVGPAVGRLDADVNVWCGYAYEQLGMPGVATLHWQLARRSPHHPEAASFASRRLALELEQPLEEAAELSRSEEPTR